MRMTGLAAAFALIVSALPAGAANWLEMNTYMIGPRYDGVVPACEYGLGVIASRFATKEGRFWNSDLSIAEFGEVRQVAFRPWAEATVPRRWCSGKVLISDGRWRQVHYAIIEDAGMIGWKWGVEWCVVGIDRNWAYNPACKMARP